MTARGVVAVLANSNAFGLTTFAANILTMLGDRGWPPTTASSFSAAISEARAAGEDRETAYYTTFRSVAPVIVGSGLTIAGATYCLSFARLPYFSTMGAPGRHRHARRRGVRGHAGAGGAVPRQPFGLFESKRRSPEPAMAAGRHRGGPLARTDFRGQRCAWS